MKLIEIEEMVLDDNREPTAADHGDVLYEIGEFLMEVMQLSRPMMT